MFFVSLFSMESFIKKVKSYPHLWNTEDLCFRNIEKKDVAWDSIARECGMANGIEAKIQWRKVRDSHREALRRRKIARKKASHKLKPWKYEKLMSFLLPQTEISAILSDCSNDSQDSSNHETTYTIKESTLQHLESPCPLSDTSRTPSPTELDKSCQLKIFTESIADPFLDIDQRRDKKLRQRDYRRMQVKDGNQCPRDALYHLFHSLCQKTRELPKYLQLRVQREIFNTVSLAEEEAMSLTENNSHF